MCLRNDPEFAKQLKAKGGKIKAWKVLYKGTYYADTTPKVKLRSPHFKATVWTPGVMQSNSRRRGLSTTDEDIENGIHVYLAKSKAEEHKSRSTNGKLVEVECELKHLLGACNRFYDGGRRAVFKQVTLSESQYYKALGIKPKELSNGNARRPGSKPSKPRSTASSKLGGASGRKSSVRKGG